MLLNMQDERSRLYVNTHLSPFVRSVHDNTKFTTPQLLLSFDYLICHKFTTVKLR